MLRETLQRIASLRKPLVGRDEYLVRLRRLVETFKPVTRVLKEHNLIGLQLDTEWSEEWEQKCTDACVQHILTVEEARAALRAIKPPGGLYRVQAAAMLSSRAYWETLATYVEYKRLFLSPEYLTRQYARKARDGRWWDSLAYRECRKLIEALRSSLPEFSIPDSLQQIVEPIDPVWSDFMGDSHVALFR